MINIIIFIVLKYKKKKIEIYLGFEPRTDGLENHCSATELIDHPILQCQCLTLYIQFFN